MTFGDFGALALILGFISFLITISLPFVAWWVWRATKVRQIEAETKRLQAQRELEEARLLNQQLADEVAPGRQSARAEAQRRLKRAAEQRQASSGRARIQELE